MRLIRHWPKVGLMRIKGETHYTAQEYNLYLDGHVRRGGQRKKGFLTVSVQAAIDKWFEEAEEAPLVHK